MCILIHYNSIFFFFNDTATTEIYTLSLHDALPINLRSQLTTFHDVPPSSERHREPWLAVWISAYTRLESEGAMATSILPTGGVGRPRVRRVHVVPPSREAYPPLPAPPLTMAHVC